MNDIAPDGINKIDLKKIYEKSKNDIIEGRQDGDESFGEILGGFMTEVNDLQLQAKDKIEKLASGEIKDIHEVMIAATEADTSFKIMMEIRSKLMSAYKEISKLGG